MTTNVVHTFEGEAGRNRFVAAMVANKHRGVAFDAEYVEPHSGEFRAIMSSPADAGISVMPSFKASALYENKRAIRGAAEVIHDTIRSTFKSVLEKVDYPKRDGITRRYEIIFCPTSPGEVFYKETQVSKSNDIKLAFVVNVITVVIAAATLISLALN